MDEAEQVESQAKKVQYRHPLRQSSRVSQLFLNFTLPKSSQVQVFPEVHGYKKAKQFGGILEKAGVESFHNSWIASQA